ncbi:unnamed protein product [Urochloa humidicola]
MSGFQVGGSPMKAAASSAASRSRAHRELVPLIDCPQCGIPVIMLRSKKEETFNWIFYKCPNNFPDDETCGYFWWEEDYVNYVRARQQKQLQMRKIEEHEVSQEVVDGIGEMRQQMLEMRQQMRLF